MARLNVGEVFPNFTVDTSSKNQVTIQELVKQKTVFWVIRYIGCTVCRYDVHLLAQKYDEIKDKGYELYVVMQSNQEHVQKDLKEASIPFDIICDPKMEIYNTLDIVPAKTQEELIGDLEALQAKGKKAGECGFVHGDYEGDELQLPALFVVDENCKVTYSHYGKHITDMPSVDELVDVVLK